MGGGFGGKETQPALIACIASLLAHRSRPAGQAAARPGQRHADDRQAPRLLRSTTPSASTTTAGSRVWRWTWPAAAGMSPDLSNAVVDRAMFHADNAYYLPAARITGHRCKTHTVSNTPSAASAGAGDGWRSNTSWTRSPARWAGSAGGPARELLRRSGSGRHPLLDEGDRQHRAGSGRPVSPIGADYARRRAGHRRLSTASSPLVKKGLALRR